MPRYRVKVGFGRAPVWVGAPAVVTLSAGASFDWAPYASDADFSPLTFSLPSAPSGYSITSAGLMTAGPDTASLTVRVSDGDRSADHAVTVTVGATDQVRWLFDESAPFELPEATPGVAGEYDLSGLYEVPPGVTEALSVPAGTIFSIEGSKLKWSSAVSASAAPYFVSVALSEAVPVPGQVVALTATAVSGSQVTLSWAGLDNAEGYYVERLNAGAWSLIGTVTLASFDDLTVSPSTSYSYRVRGFNQSGPGAYSTTASVTTPGQTVITPDQVTGLQVTGVGSNFVGLAWSAAVNATSYAVERSLNGTTWAQVGTSAGANYNDTTVVSSTSYQYRVRAFNLTTPGAYSASVSATTTAASSGSDWTARSTESGVVWAHRFDYVAELTNHLNPADNADLGAPVDPDKAPAAVMPHIITDGGPCLEITQIGATLAAVLDEATTPDVASGCSITAAVDPDDPSATPSKTVGTLTIPVLASDWGIEASISAFKITSGLNAGLFLNARAAGKGGTPTAGNPTTLSVQTSGRTPLVADTGFSVSHVRMQDLDNAYQDMVIDEHVDTVGAETWPAPTGWSESAPKTVPDDAYTVVIHDEQTINGNRALYRDKVTVVRKTYNPTTKLSTLKIRRATMGAGDAGRHESFVVNRYYPCSFGNRTGGVSNVTVGRDVTGGWTRPLAALSEGANGKPVTGTGANNDRAANGTVTRREWYTVKPNTWNFRTGYYGHQDYHQLWQDGLSGRRARFTPNTYSINGAYPFDGNEFWLSWRMKYSPMYVYRVDSSKTFFLDQYQTPDDSQIVGSSPKIGRFNWAWFHNYGSYANSDFPNVTWTPPLGAWFAMKIHIRAGHDNCIEYRNSSGGSATTVIVDAISPVLKDDPTINAQYGVANSLQFDCTLIDLKPGLTNPLTGGYYATEAGLGNPSGLSPQTDGYFNDWGVTFITPTTAPFANGRKFRVLSHTIVNGRMRLVVTKGSPADSWPTGALDAGTTLKIGWLSMDQSARYKDSLIELYKREAADSDWMQLASFYWAITFNGGISTTSAGNPSGWSNFQPTGYANIDDGNPPGSHTIWTRYGEIILSHSDIAAPSL